jgi:S-adenosylmethionine decarboxylase
MSGVEWVVEAHGCAAGSLREVPRLRTLFATLIAGLALHPVGEAAWHQFSDQGGVTGLCMLAESHLACHTFPEYGSLCLNLFCCRPRPEYDFEAVLKSEFRAVTVRVRRIERPYRTDEPQNSELPELRSADQVPVV